MYYKKLELPETEVYLYESIHSKGEHVSEHYHNVYQILYALDGEGTIILDGREYVFSKDCIVLIVPNSVHSIQAHTKLAVLVFAFSRMALGLFGEQGILNIFNNKSKHYELDPFTASEVRQLLRKMLFEQTDYDYLCQFATPVYLLETLLILARLHTVTRCNDANEMRSLRIREYINTHYFENITAQHLASRFGISTRYMNDIFKAKFNETPLQYLQKVRINRAKELLLETDKDIISICFEVGYESLSTFYRTFRNLTGISPNKFRTSQVYSNHKVSFHN
ncbi:AraC-like DNA-binding protein [Caldalkalibacillus uzonensis]|uniref:AraC-like DNA-binding protein n=1 Tax=Caldalkalibacillus uzonensis TaxID=353224 RepID=A0ABU0CWD9_9BACI|nr:AraC family transcriptional regulator [Caldalkalibacillus uzonensis]MDQ0339362.1 AraC-like DNA-binding protein [Caldalkalibacillus uzonensis]